MHAENNDSTGFRVLSEHLLVCLPEEYVKVDRLRLRKRNRGYFLFCKEPRFKITDTA